MKAVCLHDKREIESFLRGNVYLHIYGIGDLDDFFWPYTTWYALKDTDGVKAIVLMYRGAGFPCVLALVQKEKMVFMRELLRALLSVLPGSFYAHLSPGTEEVLSRDYALKSHGEHYKMALKDKSLLAGIDTSEAVGLSKRDLEEVTKFFGEAYPGNCFEPRMLETNQYYGVRGADGLISVAGVHVYSPRYRVAALGNIATHPKYRGKGYGTVVTAKLCGSLLREVDHIGLNVKADNKSAIRCYEKLGFEVVCSYGEYEVEPLTGGCER